MVALAPGVEPSTSPTPGAGALPDGPVTIARTGEVEVLTEGSGIELVGFHGSDPSALALDPVGPVDTPDPDAVTDVGPAIVLPTRQRGSAPTSAVDLAMTPGHRGAPAPHVHVELTHA